MATLAQHQANRANAQLSTGPTTPAGKAAVAQNHLSHGLASATFTVLPIEDPAAYESLLRALTSEHQPATPTEHFLVTELARAQWKLDRTLRLEAAILAPPGEAPSDWSAVAAAFRNDCSGGQALLKLNRYEQAARRAWHKALDRLTKLRAAAPVLHSAPEPPPTPQTQTQNYGSNPIPAHLVRELDAHRRRDPLFDPRHDASQMSKELRRWFAKAAAAA